MRRRVLITLLALGTVVGYSSGFASLYRWHRYGHPHGGHCSQGRHYDDPSPHGSWAPARAPQPPQAPAPSEAPPAPRGEQVQ